MRPHRSIATLVPLIVLAAWPARAQPPASARAISQIQTALERDDVATAKQIADAALAASPDDPVLHNFAGVVAARQDDAAAAERHFREAIRLAPKAVPPRENLARLYLQGAADPVRARKSLDLYTEVLALDPTHADARFQSALLHAVLGEFAPSLALLDRLPPEVRGRPQVLAVRLADLAGAGKAQDAGTLAKALAASPDLVADDIAAVLPAFSRMKDDEALGTVLAALDARGAATADLQRRLATVHMGRGRYAEARAVLERAAAGTPTVPILLDLARAADLAGDHTGALGYLAYARTLEPENPSVHFMFGIVCVELDLGREAYESLQKAVRLDPENPTVNYVMGSVALTRRDPEESLPYLEKYVRARPDDPRGRLVLGVARLLSQQIDRARTDLEEAARHPETAMGAHYYLGRLARQANDLPTARRELEAAIALNSKYPDSWAELGLVQMREGDYTASEASLAKALAIDPDHYNATVNLAALYGRTKDPRREATTARVNALQKKREQRTQDFLRLIEVVPPAR